MNLEDLVNLSEEEGKSNSVGYVQRQLIINTYFMNRHNRLNMQQLRNKCWMD